MNSVIDDLSKRKETVYINPDRRSVLPHEPINGQKFLQIQAAQNRFLRFMPYLNSAFPETAQKKGVIESNLLEVPSLETQVKKEYGFFGKLYIKDDAHLAVAGSVKARGGIHEVFCFAEKLLQKEKKLLPTDNYSVLDSEEYRRFFGDYTIQVGSTGNLGLSIGIISAKMGFHVIVHMSSDAKEWKKELLRNLGVEVREYAGDYSLAVAEGRRISEEDPKSHFVDDEQSKDLFFGYSTAAMRLTVQLYKAGITVDENHPLFVYLPCGVGGAPGGITFGLREMFGDFVHCFFAEPVDTPCVTFGMAEGGGAMCSIDQIGLTGKTLADGLAVGRPSGFVCNMMKPLMSGSMTVTDQRLLDYMHMIYETENLFLEPSACAGLHGATALPKNEEFIRYLETHRLTDKMEQSTHIVWATGGGLVPEEERLKYLSLGYLD